MERRERKEQRKSNLVFEILYLIFCDLNKVINK